MPDKFEDILVELLSSRYDEKSTTDEEYANQLKSVHQEFVKRNKKLTSLLENYIEDRKKRIKSNDFFKKFIFWLFVGLLIILTVVLIIVFTKADINNPSFATVVSLGSTLGTYLASVLSIFQIMSKYLFPPDEEKDTIEMIKAVIQNDVEVERMMSDVIKETRNIDVDRLVEYKKLLDNRIIEPDEFNELKSKVLEKIKNLHTWA